tara:strand:+ start:761 stop:1288 length:528 start_codon:yes stop_codon:yes gene_type:complete
MSWFLDSLAVLFIIGLGYTGFKRGFIEELGRLLGLLSAILIAVSNSSSLYSHIHPLLFADEWLSMFLSFALLFFLTLIVSRLLTSLIHIVVLSDNIQLMNRSLGFIFGSIKGGFILIVFIWFIAILPLKKWTMFIEQNSRLAQKGNLFRVSIVSFFNWDDPVLMSESYIKQLTQP